MATTSPTVLDKVFDLAPGDVVTLECRTSTANIYFTGPPDNGRVPFTPEDSHLREIGYEIQGKFLGVEYPETADGIAYVITSRSTDTTHKMQRTPILAITRTILH